MTKPMTTTFGTIVLGTTYYGAVAHNSILSFILDTHRSATLIRAILTLLVCMYCFVGTVRNRVSKYAVIVLGLGLLYFGVVGLLTPQLSDVFNYFVLPVDIFFAIEGGIIALLAGLELPLNTPKPMPLRATQLRHTSKKAPALSAKTA